MVEPAAVELDRPRAFGKLANRSWRQALSDTEERIRMAVPVPSSEKKRCRRNLFATRWAECRKLQPVFLTEAKVLRGAERKELLLMISSHVPMLWEIAGAALGESRSDGLGQVASTARACSSVQPLSC